MFHAFLSAYHGLPQSEGRPAEQFANLFNMKNATVYRISGLSFVDEYQIKKEEEKEEITLEKEENPQENDKLEN